MSIQLKKANLSDAELIYKMQVKAFMPLLEIYQDYETNPAKEPLEKIIERLGQSFTDYYLILFKAVPIGGIRIVKLDSGNKCRISPMFVLPEYQGQGIAQKVIKRVEEIYSQATGWELDTILQEKGNCYLYEKMGYKKTGKIKAINDKLTLVFYEK